MILLPLFIGSPLSNWMHAPGDDDDDQRRCRPSKQEDAAESPVILWAVQLEGNRKAVLVQGERLFVGQGLMDIQPFDGVDAIAQRLVELNISKFEEAKARLPVKLLAAVVALEELKETQRQREPPQLAFSGTGTQLKLQFAS